MRRRLFRKRVFARHRNQRWQYGIKAVLWALVIFQALRLLFSPSILDFILCLVFIALAIVFSIKK